ncbi:ribose-phosphate pyrophosphokinase [Clostridium sp.]|uniref:ribose-phosphate pyrophosphokinase n=1 Tax=Clostridium sp. TaxID=1506 RepID=UPI00284A9E9C|nr:ribose-phosphate pyrophosphokinase [Clostridium sp.]MDR3595275.1 ribose-phosphate pyrophosphokinase [Clostridium sp.]
MIWLNNIKVDVTRFPNGESLVSSENLIINDEINTIKLKFENDEDITHLVFLKGHLDDLNVKSKLVIGYLPYSRMDRTEGMTVFTLKHLCRLINNLKFEDVSIYEPHSDVCVALLDRVKVINMSQSLAKTALEKINKDNEAIYLVYPDAGAAKRYGKQIKYDKVLTANKERDFKTGRIMKLEVNGTIESNSFTAVIVDDLCSKGGTFILTAEKLKEMGANEIYLVVTHCEDTIFEGDILNSNLITKVFTTNSILSKEHEKLDVINII